MITMNLLSYQSRFEARLAEVEHQLGDTNVFANPQKASELGREHARVKKLLQHFINYHEVQIQITNNETLKTAHKNEPEMLEIRKKDGQSAR